MSKETALYQVQNLSFEYTLGTQKVSALRQIQLTIPRGVFWSLSGPSGSGKTTLLSLLGLIEPLQSGEILLDSQKLSELSENEKNQVRRFKLGFIFQNFHLFPVLSAAENVEYFLIQQGVAAPERRARVKDALEMVGLAPHSEKRPLEMSGGQRQRVAIARALAKRPEVLIADEPTASLDQQTGSDILNVLKKLNQELGVTVIVSSHDPMVHQYSSKVLHLRDGQLDSKTTEAH